MALPFVKCSLVDLNGIQWTWNEAGIEYVQVSRVEELQGLPGMRCVISWWSEEGPFVKEWVSKEIESVSEHGTNWHVY